MNFLTDIYWNVLYSFGRCVNKFAIFVRGKQYVSQYYDLLQLHYHPCVGCGQQIPKPDEFDYIVCMCCVRKTCLTFCENCNRKIWTRVDKKPTHLEMEYCEYCVIDLSDELKQTLQHERICIYNKRELKFELHCKK